MAADRHSSKVSCRAAAAVDDMGLELSETAELTPQLVDNGRFREAQPTAQRGSLAAYLERSSEHDKQVDHLRDVSTVSYGSCG